MLNRNHAAGGKTAPIAIPLHFVNNRCFKIPGAQKVGMQRMRSAPFNRGACGHQRLSKHLSSEDTTASNVTAFTPKEVGFEALKIQVIYEFL
jgi:hypothetical protein